MRIFALLAAMVCACLIGVAHAEKIDISGTHDKSEIRKACQDAGGDSWDVGGSYGCVTECPNSNGGLGVCGISCTNGKCTGTVPGRTISGSRAMHRLLKGDVITMAPRK